MNNLSQLYFYLVDGCNLRCRHCWIMSDQPESNPSSTFLDLDLFRSILSQAKPLGLSGVKLTGGEPLLHPQFMDILEEIRKNETRLVVETNGTLCSDEIAQKIASCRNAFVSVSLDGANSEAHEWMRGVEGSFESAKQGIQNLVKAGLKPQIIMTLAKRNKDQILEMIHLAESLGVGSIKFNLLQPILKAKEMYQAEESLTIKEMLEIGRVVENDFSETTNVRLHYSTPIAFKSLSKMFGKKPEGCGFCGILSILGVLADGSYALCGIGKTVPELIFGHSKTDSLQKIWEENPILQELREGLPNRFEGVCSECVMKNFCLGGCIAGNYYQSQNIWSSFWFCTQADQQGLFPKTRLIQKKLTK